MAAAGGIQVLPSGAGYGIVIGIGGVFALLMLGITWLQNRYTRFSTKQVRGNTLDIGGSMELLSLEPRQRSSIQLRVL